MRTETFELIKYLDQRGGDNPAAAHFADFIKLSPDKDAAAEEVRKLLVETATNAASLVQDMGLVAHDAFYPEESKRVIDAARRMCNHVELEEGVLPFGFKNGGIPHNTVEALKIAVVEYEENVLAE